jgi:hypothetical protein
MQSKKKFTGIIQITNTSGFNISKTKIKSNVAIYEDKLMYNKKGDLKRFTGNDGNLKEVNVSESPASDCLVAVVDCLNREVGNMGYYAYAEYCITYPLSAVKIMGDCMLHESACLGLTKPTQTTQH